MPNLVYPYTIGYLAIYKIQAHMDRQTNAYQPSFRRKAKRKIKHNEKKVM